MFQTRSVVAKYVCLLFLAMMHDMVLAENTILFWHEAMLQAEASLVYLSSGLNHCRNTHSLRTFRL